MKKLERPPEPLYGSNLSDVQTKDCEEFVAHCNNIARILSHSRVPLGEKIELYLDLTGARVHEV